MLSSGHTQMSRMILILINLVKMEIGSLGHTHIRDYKL